MRRIHIIGLILFCGLNLFGEKIFEADFDKQNPAPLQSPAKLVEGLYGKGALVAPDSPLVFDSKSRINPNQGTLSFWVKPLDWSAEDTKTWFPLFWLGAARCRGAYWYLILTTKGALPALELTSKRTGKDQTARCFLMGTLRKQFFQKGQWSNVVISWDRWQFHIFLNGKQYATGGYNHPIDSVRSLPEYKLWFGNHQFWGSDLKYSSVFDNIEIFDEKLEAHQIQALYAAGMPYVPKTQIQHRMPVPATAAPVKIDGVIDASEWRNATRFPLNKRFFKGNVTTAPAWGQIQYDDQYLYLAAEVPVTGKLITPGRGFDRRAFSGDNFEVTLRSPRFSKSDDPFFQLAVAPNGSWALNNFGKEQPDDTIRHAVRSGDGNWQLELAIPRAILPEKFQPGDTWLGQFGIHNPSDETLSSLQDAILCWAHCYDSFPGRYLLRYATPHVMGQLRFGGNDAGVRINSLGRLAAGELELQLDCMAPHDAAVELSNDDKTLFTRDAEQVTTFSASYTMPEKGNAVLTVTTGPRDNPDFAWQAILDVRDLLAVTPVIYPSNRTIALNVSARLLPPAWQQGITHGGLSLKAVLRHAEDRQIVTEQEYRLTKLKQQFVLNYPHLAPGRYELTVTAARGDAQIVSTCRFERPSEEFLSESYRFSTDAVPAPWTPIQWLGDHEFSVWGRNYRFGASGLPETIDSQGESILTAPVELKVTANNRRLVFSEAVGPVETLERSDTRVVQKGRSRTPGGVYILDWKRTIEFDGMVYYEVELSSGSPRLQLNALALDFRVAAASSRYLQLPHFSREWSEKNRVDWKHTNYYWFTGIRTGLDFFTPDDGNWVYGQAPVHFTRNRRDGDANAVISLIDRPVNVAAKLTYRFGFMATPVRSLRPDWRKFNTQAWGYAKNQNWQYHLGYNDKKELLQFPNIILLTDVSNPDNARRVVRNHWHARNMNIVPFAGMNFMPDNNPFYDYYATSWRQTIGERPTGKSYGSRWQGKEFYMCSPVCPRSTYPDFLRWCVVNLMRKYDFDGVYLDGGQALQCDNACHGCGFTDAFARHIQPWSDLALRKAYRELQAAIHAVKPEAILWVHAAEKNAPHIHDFADLLFPGEDIMPLVPANPKAYTDLVPLEQWQSSYYIQHTMGVAATFLGMSQKVFDSIVDPPKDPEISTPLLAMCFVHDAHLFGNFIYCKTIEKVWQIEAAAGLTAPDTVFTGYWFPKRAVTADNPEVLVSYYTWPGSDKCVIVTANRSAKPLTYRLEFGPEIAVGDGVARDLWNGKTVDLKQPLTLPPCNFSLFQLH